MKHKESAKLLAKVYWYEKMVEAYKLLSSEELAALDRWEQSRANNQDISDWPGWERYIGAKPHNERE